MNNLVDMAAVGTQQHHIIGSETHLLREAGIVGLQHKAGYVPATMPPETPAYLPVADNYATCADAMMTRFCNQEVVGANPRAPYLVVIWLLLGSDNPFCFRRYTSDSPVILSMSILFLRIACGDEPTKAERDNAFHEVRVGENQTKIPYGRIRTAALRTAGLLNARRTQIPWVAWLASAIVQEIALVGGGKVEPTIWKQARQWRYISDEEAGRVALNLLFDMVDGKNRASPQL
jgi:hypothetical protein